MSAGNILTTGGFTKLSHIPQSIKDCKVVLYYLESPTTLEKVKKAKEAVLQKKDEGWNYKGDLDVFEKEVKKKNYLLKEGKTLQLIKGDENAGSHQISISNSYLFKSIVKVGGNFIISGPNANIVINIPQNSDQRRINEVKNYKRPRDNRYDPVEAHRMIFGDAIDELGPLAKKRLIESSGKCVDKTLPDNPSSNVVGAALKGGCEGAVNETSPTCARWVHSSLGWVLDQLKEK